MRLGIALFGMSMLFACASEGGLVIDVAVDDDAVDKVRLFVGAGGMMQGQTLTIEDGTTHAGVTYWSRDPGNEDDFTEIEPGETARFVLVHTEADRIPALVAVAYIGDQPAYVGKRFWLDIPADHYAVFDMEMFSVGQNIDVALWSTEPIDPRLATCVGVVDARMNIGVPRTFIVEDNNQDCDAWNNDDPLECNDNVHTGSTNPRTVDDLSCLLPFESTTGKCIAGGSRCVDGLGPQAGCFPSRYCLPANVCQTYCAEDLPCALSFSSVPRPDGWTCHLPTQPGSTDVCEVPISIPHVLTSGLECSNARIGTAALPFSDRIDSNGIRFDLTANGCAVTLMPSGSVTPGSTTNPAGAVAIDLDGGGGFIIPVSFQLDSTTDPCPSKITCTYVNGNQMGNLPDCSSPWGPPIKIDTLAVPMKDDPTLTEDMLEMYFNVDDRDIYVMTRPDRFSAWGTPTLVVELAGTTTQITTTPEVSPDGLTMYFSSNRAAAGVGISVIHISTRPDRNARWSGPTPLLEVSLSVDDFGPTADASNMFLMFDTIRNGGGSRDLYMSTRTNGMGPWTLPALQVNLSDANAQDTDAHLSYDALTVYFTSNRLAQHTDLWVSQRPTTAGVFTDASLVKSLATQANEEDPWVSRDARTMFFVSDTLGQQEIFMVQR